MVPGCASFCSLWAQSHPQLEAYGESDREDAVQKKALAKAIKEMGTSGVNVARIKSMMPL